MSKSSKISIFPFEGSQDRSSSQRFAMTGHLFLASDRMVGRNGVHLSFSHFELEIKTHGRQGRFSRENLWNPSYLDYASTPIKAIPARHLARTRVMSAISFARSAGRTLGSSVEMAYKVDLPQELFAAMKTRCLRLTARAIFLEWKDHMVLSTEVAEAEPICVSASHLRMEDFV